MNAVKDPCLVSNGAKAPIFVSVSHFRNVPRLDIRHHYYPDATGVTAPTKKGVNLPAAGTVALLEALDEVDRRDAGEQVLVDLDVRLPIFVKIVTKPNGWALDIRHYFQKNGEWLPTKKGVRMAWEDYERLEEAIRKAAPGYVGDYFPE